jgi:thiol-disulfide isomerase/thioredoxin
MLEFVGEEGMRKRHHRILGLAILITALAVSLAAGQQQQQQGQERSPGYREFVNAMKIPDLSARLRELERIKAAYPGARFLSLLENGLRNTRIGLAVSVDEILELQKPAFQTTVGAGKVFAYYFASTDILEHPNLARFDKKRVTQAVIAYSQEGLKLAKDPDYLASLAPGPLKYLKLYTPNLYIAEALAFLNEDSARMAREALTSYETNGGLKDKTYYHALGRVSLLLGKDKEAYDAYFNAAIENYKDSLDRARELYRKLKGSLNGFDAALEAGQKRLPFSPVPVKPGADWKGKAVLAELFTGSSCQPCLAADLGFDGLLESYGPKYLAVLEYHLPIPGPDPMINHVSRQRALYYGVQSTPTTFFDGKKAATGGGDRGMAREKYNDFGAEAASRLYEIPAVKVQVRATARGDSVEVAFEADKIGPGADYNLALVQAEERYAGTNGVLFHKMVVREFVVLDDAALAAKRYVIDLAAAEASAVERLDRYEKDASFTFPERHHKIARNMLKVVFFVQEKTSKEVLNAAVCDVK